MSDHKAYRVDARALVESLGGVGAVQQMFIDEGFRPLHERNIYKWIERSSISSSRIWELLSITRKRKLRVDFLDYLVEQRVTKYDD